MRLVIDAGLCTGHGRCYTLAPELLAYDDQGFVTARGGAVDVPTDQVAVAREAVLGCPEGAIDLVEEG